MRALRRHHYQRRKIKIKNEYWFASLPNHGPNTDEQAAFGVNTPHPCSRRCCGNPRKHFRGKTRQELMHTIEFDLKSELG